MPVGYQLLEVARVNRIMSALQDVRELPSQLTFLARCPVVPAEESEIMARWTGRVQIADLIADDQAAVTYSAGKIAYETTNVPNLKHGASVSQAMLNQLQAINAAGAPADQTLFSDYENRLVDGLLLGIRQRMEALIVAMHLDGFSYDRLGIKMSDVSWGMPSDLKLTPSTPWTTAGSATPVSDILSTKRLGQARYGVTYDRMIMSLAAFSAMVATTEFQNHCRFVLPTGQPPSILPLQNTDYQRNLATNVLGLREIELYDGRYWSQDSSGTLASAPFLPINKVILADSSTDNDPMAYDFASGVVTETLVAGLAPTNIVGRFEGPARGPVAYATAEPSLNPPGLTYWGCSRGFPRRHRLQMNAVLTVSSTLTDLIEVGEPF